MYYMKPLFQNRKGYTIIEFIIGIGIMGLLISNLFSILNLSTRTTKLGVDMDETLLNGRYGMELIKTELRNGDKIISTSKIEGFDNMYPDNFGFVIFKDNPPGKNGERYNFSTFYLKEDKIMRIAINKKTIDYPPAKSLSGHNEVCIGVLSISGSSVSWEEQLINLRFSMGYDGKEFHKFRTCIFLDKVFDY